MTVPRRSKETDAFRERMYDVKVDDMINHFEVMRAFDDYLQSTVSFWETVQDGHFIYAKCNHCKKIHGVKSAYCPDCGFAMDSNH